MNATLNGTRSELFPFFFRRLIWNAQKQACVVSARIHRALVILAGLSTSISSNSFNNLVSAQLRSEQGCCHRSSWPDGSHISCGEQSFWTEAFVCLSNYQYLALICLLDWFFLKDFFLQSISFLHLMMTPCVFYQTPDMLIRNAQAAEQLPICSYYFLLEPLHLFLPHT